MKGIVSNFEIVILAVYLLGGDYKYVDTEDVAVKANEMANGRFAWKKYPDQINIELIRVNLSNAKKPSNGSYLHGSGNEGWQLSKSGLKFAKDRIRHLKNADLSRKPVDKKEIAWRRQEKSRMIGTTAFKKVSLNNEDTVTAQEAEAFFRIDDYVTGKAREIKLTRIVNAFGDDSDLGKAIKTLAEKVRNK
jgi:hypothetical protein